MNGPSLSSILGAAETLLHSILSDWGASISPQRTDQDGGLEGPNALLMRGGRIVSEVSLL